MKILHADIPGFHAQHIAAMLTRRGFALVPARSGREVLDLLGSYGFDAVVLGRRLADMETVELARAIRLRGLGIPVMVLSDRRAQPEAIAAALHAGTDDFVATPIPVEELAMRLTALVRRAHGHSSTRIHCGPVRIDLAARSAEVAGRALKLTRREYGVLEALALRKGRPVSREELFDTLYGGEEEPSHKIIDVYVCKLRRKLAAVLRDADPIETVWGHGYRLRDAAAAAAAA